MFFLLKPMEILLFYQNKKYKHSSFFICTFFFFKQRNFEIYIFFFFYCFSFSNSKKRFVSWKAAFSLTSNIYQSLPDDWSPDLQTFPSKYDYDYISTFPQIYGKNIEIFIFPTCIWIPPYSHLHKLFPLNF